MKKIVIGVAIIGMVMCKVYSQQEVYLSAERVVITPERYETNLKDLPLSVSVINRKDIELINKFQTTDLLDLLPGVFIMKTSAFGRADVNIRGIGNNGRQLGILIDGRPDKMSLMGCSVTHTLPLNNIERIEVIRGPESVVYGSEAFGGVVNIITRRASKNLEIVLDLYGGSFNTWISRLQVGRNLNKVSYMFSVDKRDSDGHTENSSYKATDFGGNFNYLFNDGSQISLSGKYFDGLKYEPLPAVVGTWNDYKRGSVDLNYKKDFSFVSLDGKYYRSFGEHKFSDGWNSQDYTDGVVVNGRTNLSGSNILSYGIDYRYLWVMC